MFQGVCWNVLGVKQPQKLGGGLFSQVEVQIKYDWKHQLEQKFNCWIILDKNSGLENRDQSKLIRESDWLVQVLSNPTNKKTAPQKSAWNKTQNKIYQNLWLAGTKPFKES